MVKGLIQEGDWLTKLDMKDAYLTPSASGPSEISKVPMTRSTVAV